ncbi:hypothetical protein TD95_000415 [Thielaviopsis punctulata]|uniref:Uncharacterized protein n=1 Tax=Thielaviopsis punctulata TaxID=72032 RepID=A0A0F4ZJ15_9PEZI|nr:hypothetical protein TD95_000415 [Thielaviopsis punctulata]
MHSSYFLALVAAHMAAAATTVSVSPSVKHQNIDGFGMSQAFGRATQFKALSEGPRKQGLDYLFSTTTGAGFSIIRNRIGSGGYGDSIEPTSPGSATATPKYVWDDNDEGQVWFSQQAVSYGVSTVYANAWSAPVFMRTAENYGRLCGVEGETCSTGDWRQAYVDMIIQYIGYYKAINIPITHVGFLNEPDGSNFMLSSAEQAADVIPMLRESLDSKGYQDILMTCCDNIGWKSQQNYTQQLNKADMMKYLGVISSHGYSSAPTDPMGNTNLPTWITEDADLSDKWCTTWYADGNLCEGFSWALRVADGMVNAGLSAYLYWEGVEVNQQQASSYLVLATGNNVYPSGRLWAFAHWSRYIRPGATRIGATTSAPDMIVGAFENKDGSYVVVLTNSATYAQEMEVDLSGASVSAVAEAVSSDNNAQMAKTTATLSGGKVLVSVPAKGVVTVKLTSSYASVASKEAVSSSKASRDCKSKRVAREF